MDLNNYANTLMDISKKIESKASEVYELEARRNQAGKEELISIANKQSNQHLINQYGSKITFLEKEQDELIKNIKKLEKDTNDRRILYESQENKLSMEIEELETDLKPLLAKKKELDELCIKITDKSLRLKDIQIQKVQVENDIEDQEDELKKKKDELKNYENSLKEKESALDKKIKGYQSYEKFVDSFANNIEKYAKATGQPEFNIKEETKRNFKSPHFDI